MQEPTSRIVVGVDGSAASIDAIRWAVRYADLTGAQVTAVTSWATPWAAAEATTIPVIDWAKESSDALDTALSAALQDDASLDRTVSRLVVEGHPAQVLITAAKGADLLVVGSRGHGGFTGMLLGSVSEHVIAHAPCPVLVIRHPKDSAES